MSVDNLVSYQTGDYSTIAPVSTADRNAIALLSDK